MTVGEAIARLDGRQYNDVPYAEKKSWLEELERMLAANVYSRYEAPGPVIAPLEPDTVLLAEGFDELYLKWLEARVDLYNAEPERYNAAIALFNAEYAVFESRYNREYMPLAAGAFRF